MGDSLKTPTRGRGEAQEVTCCRWHQQITKRCNSHCCFDQKESPPTHQLAELPTWQMAGLPQTPSHSTHLFGLNSFREAQNKPKTGNYISQGGEEEVCAAPSYKQCPNHSMRSKDGETHANNPATLQSFSDTPICYRLITNLISSCKEILSLACRLSMSFPDMVLFCFWVYENKMPAATSLPARFQQQVLPRAAQVLCTRMIAKGAKPPEASSFCWEQWKESPSL